MLAFIMSKLMWNLSQSYKSGASKETWINEMYYRNNRIYLVYSFRKF